MRGRGRERERKRERERSKLNYNESKYSAKSAGDTLTLMTRSDFGINHTRIIIQVSLVSLWINYSSSLGLSFVFIGVVV